MGNLDNLLNWDSLTLFIYITARVSVSYAYTGVVTTPGTLLELMVKILLELGLGFMVGMIMQMFFFIPALAGTVMDEQMGLAMAATYDPGFQGNMTPSANLLNIYAMLLFIAANGHYTLLRLMISSGNLVPFGAAAFGEATAERVVEIFADCALMGVKLCMPILAAEFMGQIGMGVLMKVIPQINVFAINIELKVLVGTVILFFLLSTFSEYILAMETTMLSELEKAVSQIAGG